MIDLFLFCNLFQEFTGFQQLSDYCFGASSASLKEILSDYHIGLLIEIIKKY
jgi:hypothetical protein